MLLRSSSTPILGSLLSSYAESPNHNHNHNHGHHNSDFNSPRHPPKKLSFHQTTPRNHIAPSSTCAFNSSPSINAEFTQENSRSNGFRRVQSDGNLEGLVSGSCNSFDEFNTLSMSRRSPRKPNCSVLQTIPSFTTHSNRTRHEEDDDEEEDETDDEEEQEGEKEESTDTTMAFMNSSYNGFENINYTVELENEEVPSKMHLAMGLGAFSGGFTGGFNGSGGHKEHKPKGFGGDSNNGTSIEEYYQRMLGQNPGNPLFLRNYAQFLHQSKKDLTRAEEYYSRALLVDPGDGEILSKYAQLTWELHRDEERASSYFQRAVQAAPEDSHVLAAYASFLWEAEEDADNDMLSTNHLVHHGNTVVAAKS